MKTRVLSFGVSALASCLLLSACGGGGSGEDFQTVSVKSVNDLIVASDKLGSEYALKCSEESMEGCFIIPNCRTSSGYFSTRMVIGVESDRIKAFMLAYNNSNCAGAPHLHPTVWSQWVYTLENVNEDTHQGELSLMLDRYDDGYVFDYNKPRDNVVYRSLIWVDDFGTTKKLCLSDGLIDQTRPLKFMSTEADALDSSNCAEELL